jgi:hypothetical protein
MVVLRAARGLALGVALLALAVPATVLAQCTIVKKVTCVTTVTKIFGIVVDRDTVCSEESSWVCVTPA